MDGLSDKGRRSILNYIVGLNPDVVRDAREWWEEANTIETDGIF
jgi:hypothetical protein